ncbi:MAG: hypothetical protein K2R98_26165 [Gemmataceae bacterium]|nr:hypothetical protein [Gemmataceae bacterium]
MVNLSASDLLAQWQAGDQQAAAELFRRYAGRLIALARGQLSAQLNRRLDPEDVIQSVYRSFFVRARAGQYQLPPGADLWALLVAMTLHKLREQVRHNNRGKRAVAAEEPFAGDGLLGLQPEALARGPSPVESALLQDQMDHLMAQLDPLHRRMLELRLQGYNLEEIAIDTHRSERTVIRVLDGIKQQLGRESDHPDGGPTRG